MGDNLDNAFSGIKNPHSSAFVKLWGNLIPLLYLLYRVRKNVSRANNRTFCRITQPHCSRWKINSKRVATTVSEQRSKTTKNACVKCGIVYHNCIPCRVRKQYVSGQNPLKRITIPRFYQENILTKACVYAMIFPASERGSTRSKQIFTGIARLVEQRSPSGNHDLFFRIITGFLRLETSVSSLFSCLQFCKLLK